MVFLVTALNGNKILAGDIQSAYINARTQERVCVACGSEFGSNAGRHVRIVKAIYDLTSNGARFRDHLSQ